MKPYPLLTAVGTFLFCLFTANAREEWSQDFETASKRAASEKKDLLIDFTGSDWCGPCIALERETFSKEAFLEGVKDNFVLVKLDYPKDKTKLDPLTLQQNQRIQRAYGIAAYPTILLCDAAGKPYAATGYLKTTPEDYLNHLDGLRSNKAARDETFAKAAVKTGSEKANLLVLSLSDLGLEDTVLASSYGEVLDQIKQAEPDNSFLKKALSKRQLAQFRVNLEEYLEEPGIHMIRGLAEGKSDEALAMIDGIIASDELEPEDLVDIAIYRATRIHAMDSIDNSIESLDAIETAGFDPASLAKLEACRKSLEARKKALGAAKQNGG